jgi:hypothetical protein
MATRQQFISQLGACTRTINAEIKKQIIEVGAVRTGRMKNNTKVKVEYDFNKEVFVIKDVNSTFYYKFVDEGTRFIVPRKITEKTMNRSKVEKAFAKLFDVYIEYLIDREFEVYGI